MRTWPIDADLDFPPERIQLWLQAVTATEFDFVARQLKPIEAAAWRQIKDRYDKIAADHALVCKYPGSNDWLRSHSK